MDNVVVELVKAHGWSKWAIAREIGVSWQTVAFWYKGVYKPKGEHQSKLDSVYRIEKEKVR